MIIRSVSSHDVAENPGLVSRLKLLYDRIDSSVKPTTLRVPGAQKLATLQKLWSSISVYRIFNNAVEERQRSGIKRDDALQQLLDAGESKQCVVGVCWSLLLITFLTILNTDSIYSS